MFVFVRFNKNLETNLDKIKEYNHIPVILFNFNLNNKQENKLNLDKIIKLKQNYSKQILAIELNLQKQDNSTASFINSLNEHFNILIGKGGENKTNRFFIEQTKIDILLDPQQSNGKRIDFIHHFNSGLNQVLLKLMQEKQISLFHSLNFLNNSNQFLKSKEIGRINQNIIFSNKYKLSLTLNYIIENPGDIKTIQELNSIVSIFNISKSQLNENKFFLEKLVEENSLKKSKSFITQEIQLI